MDIGAVEPFSVLAGIVAGVLLATAAWLAAFRRSGAVAEARRAELADERDRVRGQVEQLRAELRGAEQKAVRLETELQSERRAHAARQAEIEEKFQTLASKALDGNAEKFLARVTERFEKHSEAADADLAKRQTAIEGLVKPVQENLQKFEQKVAELEKARAGAYEAIQTQVKALAEGQKSLTTETGRLVNALRTPKTRGRWGEFQLRQVFDMAGMVEHVDFTPEHHVPGEGGARRPDAIVRLPGGKSIVVDAKTPLDGYLTAVEATDEEAREIALANHVRQVKDHVKGLAAKEYWSALDDTPDFVVMFVPGEAFYSAAIERDHELFEFAWRNRVLIATPTNLIALVKCIAYGWQQEKLTENARDVARQARTLYERIGTFGGHMDALGKRLRSSVDCYNKAVGSLERSVLPAARRFESLGVVGAGSELPEATQVDSEPRALAAAEFHEAEPSSDKVEQVGRDAIRS